jgi:nitrogen fixation protein NifU and related proteins
MEKELIEELYQSMILEHSKHPRNFGILNCSCFSKGKNPSCGDELTLFIDKDSQEIKDIKFEGKGCAISMASSSLMTQAVKGKSILEAKELLKDFVDFILDDKELDDKYEPLHIFAGVKRFPLRVKCVLLAWRTMEHILDDEQTIATSE